MGKLAEPYDLLDLQDRETVTFRVIKWEEGELTIKTTDEPEGKVITALRVWVMFGDKAMGAPYWDISSKLLRADLVPHLQAPGAGNRTFKVTAHGVRPRKRFTLEVH